MITPVQASIFYVNDYHGKPINIERTVTASKVFDSTEAKDMGFPAVQTVDKLKLSSGDFQLGEDLGVNRMAVAGMNLLGVTASAMGNHECDAYNKLNQIIPDMRYKLLACNIKFKPENPLGKKVEKSFIQEVNGHKYGIIGAGPTDLALTSQHHISANFDISSINKSIVEVQKEVDKLRKQGVDKIILLSHVGYRYDKRIAQETEGIDIILSGHSHELLQGVKEGENLFYSKTGEPVVIIQAGRDGNYFGVLNVEFDEKGILKKIQNNVSKTADFERDTVATEIFNHIMGKPREVGYINSAPPPVENDCADPNPHANFFADRMKEALDTEIVLLCASTIRTHLMPGKIDSQLIEEISPFKNNLCIVDYSEKELVDALKYSAKSQILLNNKPGIMHTSGLKYTMSKNGKLLSASFIEKDGSESPIDIKNPSTDVFYKTGIIDFHAAGNDGYTMLNKISTAKVTDLKLVQCVEDYIKAQGHPIDIPPDDGRVKVI